eukprot:CAMPEP_0114994048 /NCGR_PEP_ID=MMETSP0216-20121206/12892_1 /TAXON_ID=223996 /ORGANISM="Protocruzia adherens, Strain Boccale" /LENGTH=200 /DNA_ID=CAMNT_0002357805 /DNA_START=46 /DNA_END=648 /DNA_ORIENTATION=+
MDSANSPSLAASADMCVYCFDVLSHRLEIGHRNLPGYPNNLPNVDCPLFVTWTKGRNEDLRGCIGTFSPSSLATLLPRYALIAAFEDSRFKPIQKKELPQLNCAVSLLTEFEDINDPMDWQIGTHGITIDFEVNGRTYGATFLPEVMDEWGWTQKETYDQLLEKSGYRGSLSSVYEQLQVTRYQSSKHTLSYQQYVTIKA